MLDFEGLIDLLEVDSQLNTHVLDDSDSVLDMFGLEEDSIMDLELGIDSDEMGFDQLESTTGSEIFNNDLEILDQMFDTDSQSLFDDISELGSDALEPITNLSHSFSDDGGDLLGFHDEGTLLQSLEGHFGDTFSFIGDPEDFSFWDYQEEDYSCAIACQKNIIDSVFNSDVPEEMLSKVASSLGVYDPLTGTKLEDIGNLLDFFEIPNETTSNASLDLISEALESGQKLIAAVDSNVINGVEDMFPSGHAVQVVGLLNDDAGPIFVLLNDPGRIDGQGLEVPVNIFLEAWNSMGNTLNYTTSLI